MSRFATLIVAPLILGAAFVTAPAMGATYLAKTAVQPEAKRIIARDISWTCGPDACQGSTDGMRPAIVCQGLAKRAGQLTSFVADGRAFGAAELTKCNLSAKGGAPTAGATATASAN